MAPIWPLTGETRNTEHVPQQQQFQRQRQPQKPVVHTEVHAPMEPQEPEVLIEVQKPDKALDQVGHPPTSEDPSKQETEVAEPLQLPIIPPQPRPMVPEQPLHQALPMPRLMPLPDTLLKVPDQPIPYHDLINPRPLHIRLLGTLPGCDNDIDDEKQPEVSIKQPDKTIYRKFR